MIRHLSLISYCFFPLLLTGYAQSQPISTPSIIKHLLNQQNGIPVINGTFIGFLPQNELPKQLQQEQQFLIKTPSNLFLGIDGTGRLYRIKSQNDEISFEREDSTFYLGSNFHSANFSIEDTIYSYGGYGFWKNNGLLRTYKPIAHEWELINTNKEIQSIFDFNVESKNSSFWVDVLSNRFYLACPNSITENGKPLLSPSAVKRSMNLYSLDITKGIWKESGILNKNDWYYWFNSPWGILACADKNNAYLNDLINNRKLEAKKQTIEKLLKLFPAVTPDIFYFIDSTLYFGNVTLNSFDSIQLSLNDFEFKGELAYTPYTTKTYLADNKYNFLWLAIIPLAISMGFLLYKRKKRKTGMLKVVEETAHHNNETALMETEHATLQKFNGKNGNHIETFSEIEKELFLFIYEKTKQEYTVSVEEINKVLGLSGKNESVQKKNRSETINNINQKWTVLHQNNHSLIERQRSEFDKRSFEYFIQPMWLDEVAEMSTAFKRKDKGR